LVAASHDRYFLERVCDDVVALAGAGTLVGLPGGVDEYLALRANLEAPAGPPVRDGEPPARPSAGATREARKQLARVERQLDKLHERERVLHEQLAAAATDYEKVQALDGELRALAIERAQLEEEWLAAADVAEPS
jgi:ATP-binding cassette subfamily F protein uup